MGAPGIGFGMLAASSERNDVIDRRSQGVTRLDISADLLSADLATPSIPPVDVLRVYVFHIGVPLPSPAILRVDLALVLVPAAVCDAIATLPLGEELQLPLVVEGSLACGLPALHAFEIRHVAAAVRAFFWRP